MGNEPVVIVDSGSSYVDKEDREWMLREQLHTQQCEINALRKALMYNQPAKELTIEDIEGVFYEKCWYYDEDEKFDYYGFARAILRKASEK